MANGKFEAKSLTFKVSKSKFAVDCGETGLLAADDPCGQKTFKTVVLPLDPDGLLELKEKLGIALAELQALELAKHESQRKSKVGPKGRPTSVSTGREKGRPRRSGR